MRIENVRCQTDVATYEREAYKDQPEGGEKKIERGKMTFGWSKNQAIDYVCIDGNFPFRSAQKKTKTENMKNVLLQTSPTKSKSHTIAVSVSQKFTRQC